MTNLVEILSDTEALAQAAADWLVDTAIHRPGDPFAVALSGGSTPRRLYGLLAARPRRERFPWERVHWFWGDERFVPPDHPKSNFRMVREAMLAKAPVPESNIHPVPTIGLTPDEAARAYQRQLATFHGSTELAGGHPLFDVTLLGLGPDGHTASLFPGSLALEEKRDWVVAVVGAQPEPRITLTYSALESSRHVAFLVAGEEKRSIYERFRRGDPTLPAVRLRPTGTLRVFLDAAAAGSNSRAMPTR